MHRDGKSYWTDRCRYILKKASKVHILTELKRKMLNSNSFKTLNLLDYSAHFSVMLFFIQFINLISNHLSNYEYNFKESSHRKIDQFWTERNKIAFSNFAVTHVRIMNAEKNQQLITSSDLVTRITNCFREK